MLSSPKFDDLGCYRLLAEVFEIPAMLDRLLGRHPNLAKDLCYSWMITAADRLLAIEQESDASPVTRL